MPGESAFNVFQFSFKAERPETLGTKEKYWIAIEPGGTLPPNEYLYKIGRPNTGENWAERVACEIATLLGLPCAKYEFAVCPWGNQGTVSERFFSPGSFLMTANTFLARFISDYDGQKRFRQIQYTLSRALSTIRRSLPDPVTPAWDGAPKEDYFVGYLVFDCLIGNTDRHHENWGVVVNSAHATPTLTLAPTFDHASSMGRELNDANRVMRLTTNDRRANVEAYAERARSAFFGADSRRTLTMKEFMAELKVKQGPSVAYWSKRVANLDPHLFERLFARIPPDWCSSSAGEFACRMLRANQSMIREIGCA